MSNWTFDVETISKEIVLRNGKVRNVELEDLNESEIRLRSNLVVDPQASKGRGRGANSGIRLDKQRAYDFNHCVKGWDLKYSDLKKSIEEDGPEDCVLPLEPAVFAKLPGYISNQINDHIQDVNSVPEDEYAEPEDGDEDGPPLRLVEEDPT